MRKVMFYPVTIIIFMVIQVVIFKYLKIYDVFPDVFLLGTIYFALKRGSVTGMHFGFFSGLTQDAFLIGPFGANALIKTLIGFLVGMFKNKIYEDNIITQLAIVFLFSFFYYWSILFLQILFGQTYYIRPHFHGVAFSAYNGLVAPIIFIAFKLWERNNVAK